MTRDEIRRAVQEQLKWIVAGDGSELRPEPDRRALIDWIDRAVDALLLDPDGSDGTMLQALREGLFTVASMQNGEPVLALTDYGRARVDSMPHDSVQLTARGVSGLPQEPTT